MKKFIGFFGLILFSVMAFAQEVTPQDFLSQIVKVVQDFGGLSTWLKIAAVLTLIVSSTKVSFLNQVLWSKLGVVGQKLLAPALGLVAGFLSLGTTMTLAGALAYISAGVGAIALHELLDGVKEVPGIGPVWLSIIDLIERFTGGGGTSPTAATK